MKKGSRMDILTKLLIKFMNCKVPFPHSKQASFTQKKDWNNNLISKSPCKKGNFKVKSSKSFYGKFVVVVIV